MHVHMCIKGTMPAIYIASVQCARGTLYILDTHANKCVRTQCVYANKKMCINNKGMHAAGNVYRTDNQFLNAEDIYILDHRRAK